MPDVQPHGERRAVPPGDWRLWAVWRHLDSEAAAHPAAENSAGGRGPIGRRPAEGIRAAHRGRVHVRRFPVFGRMRHPTTFSGRASSRVTGRSIRGRRCLRRSASSGTKIGTRSYCSRTITNRRPSTGTRSTTCPRRDSWYRSDTHQMSTYLDNYHARLDAQLAVKDRATEMITEIYVPRPALPSFMAGVAGVFRKNGVPDRLRNSPADRAG